MSTKKDGKHPHVSLVEFVRAEKRANCRICKLPVEIRGQLGRTATEKKIVYDQQVRWLNMVTGMKITAEELTKHTNGRHDVTGA